MTPRKCPYCDGTGDCQRCHGYGKIVDVLQSVECSVCDGTGKCQACDGTGEQL